MNILQDIQTSPSLTREGLPYWILWLLLCIILLLLAFIFLRDKDLRLRVNMFLSGAKRRMRRTRLQLRLNRAKRNKTVLLRELGKRVWAEKIQDDRYQPYFENLECLEKESLERQAGLKDIISRIMDLQKKQEVARQTYKQLLKLKEAGQQPDSLGLSAAKEEEKRLKKEIKDCEKKIKAGLETMKAIDHQKAEQLDLVGTLTDEARLEHKDFLGIYVQIDSLNRKILHYINEIERFR